MTNAPIDWTQPICTDTTPPRRAKVVESCDITGNAHVETDWDGDGYIWRLWVYPNGVNNLDDKYSGKPRIRNVRPGDFPDTPDMAAIAAELAAALLRAESDLHLAALDARTVPQQEAMKQARDRCRAALAKWEASK